MAVPSRREPDRQLQWVPGPSAPRRLPAGVHVWKADLCCVGERDVRWLSPAEHVRAARFPHAHQGRLWARSRGVLRRLLGAYLETDPGALRIESGPYGKPLLGAPQIADELCFNLSHSGSIALYAFGAAGAVGIDVEVARRPLDELALANRAFGPAAARRLAELAPQDRARAFRLAWVRLEAAAKCRGAGLAGSIVEMAHGPLGANAGAAWAPWVMEFDLPGEVAAALAADPEPLAVHCWEVPFRDPDVRAPSGAGGEKIRG